MQQEELRLDDMKNALRDQIWKKYLGAREREKK